MKQDNNKHRKICKDPVAPIKWEDNASRLVLYADIMGFSQRVTQYNIEILKNDLCEFKSSWETRIKPLLASGHLKSAQFSDSILFVVNGTDSKMFNLITKASVCLMQTALKRGFPIKGVIAQGEFYYNEKTQLYFGLPLVNAFNLINELHYYGIVVHHSAEQTVKEYEDSTKPYAKTFVNLKGGRTQHYHLLWHRLKADLSPGNIKDDANKWLDKIEETVSGTPRIYVDNTREIIKSDDKEYGNIVEAESLD